MQGQHMKNTHSTSRGFSLLELTATIMVLSMIGMAMGPTLKQMRSSSQGIASATNLQAIGQGAAMNAKSNNGRMFSYSWRAGETYIMPDGKERTESTDTAAAQRQNTEILIRRTGRINGEFKIENFAGRLPHRIYTPSYSTIFSISRLKIRLTLIRPTPINSSGMQIH